MHVGGATVKELKEITGRFDITWRSFTDVGQAGAGPIAKQWCHFATPTMYLLDHKGVIRYKWVGTPGEKNLDRAIEKLVAEVKKAR